jgi:excisionase family DNA binding protein
LSESEQSLAERIRAMVSGMPEGSSITLPVDTLRAWLTGVVEDDPLGDLSCEQAGKLVNRSPETIRRWVRQGRLECYKLSGRDYRIPRAALRRFLDAQRERPAGNGATGERPAGNGATGKQVDLGSWRKVRKLKQ